MARPAALLLVLLAACVSLALTACASRVYAPAPVSFNRPSQLGNAVETLGTQVGARAFDEPREAKEAFGGFDVQAAGLLPVQVVFENGGEGTLEINPAQTFLEDERGNLWPILEEQLAYDRVTAYARTGSTFRAGVHKGFLGAVAGAAIGAAIGTVSSESVGTAAARGAAVGAAAAGTAGGAAAYASDEARRRIIQDLESKRLERRPVGPGEIVHGFLFFPGEAEHARMLRLQVRDAASGQVGTVELAL
jgi:hypothetical protein